MQDYCLGHDAVLHPDEVDHGISDLGLRAGSHLGDPERLLDAQRAHPHARVLAVVHAETSTGVENDVAPLRDLQDTDTFFLLDTVTSLAGIPVEIDGWGVDAVYSGTQKCLGVPPGLSPVSFSLAGCRAQVSLISSRRIHSSPVPTGASRPFQA